MSRTFNKQKNIGILGILTILLLCFLAAPALAAPALNTVLPYAAGTGTAVKLSGSGFGATRGANSVTFGTTPVTTYSSWADNVIWVLVPPNMNPGPTQVKVTVGGVDSNTKAFTVYPKHYTVTPSSGCIGDTVTVTGDSYGVDPGVGNRSSATHHVAFYDVSYTNQVQVPDGDVTSWSQTQITCKVPNGVWPGGMLVTVYSVSGEANYLVFKVLPKIISLSPSSGAIGTTVTIEGTAFGPDPGAGSRSTANYNVKFGGVTVESADVTKWTSTEIVCKVPAGAASGNVTVTANGATSAGVAFTVPAPVIDSVVPVFGPIGTSPWTTYINIYGSHFGSSQGTSVVNFGSTAAGTAALWKDDRIVIAVPSSVAVGSPVAVRVTVNGIASNNDKTFTPIAGKMIDNYEDTGMYYYDNSKGGADEANVVRYTVNDPSYDGQYSMYVKYPGATGSQWGGYWVGSLQAPLSDIDLTSCNMLVFRVKGDGSGNTIRLDVNEYKDGTLDEPYSSMDKYPLSDSSNFKEFKVPFSRLWRNEYSGSVQDDNVFSKKIKGYTFVYQGTNLTSASHQVDFVYAVNWTGPIMDQMGPNSGNVGDTVTIEGSGFGNTQDGSTVTFNGVPATVVSWSDTEIVVVVPAGATTGPVEIVVGGETSNGIPFTVTSETRPSITGIVPSSGPSGLQVAISGSGFGNDPGAGNRDTMSNHVVFGAAKLTDDDVISWSSTQIIVKVPASAGIGVCAVQVRASDKDSNLADFTVTALSAPTVTAVSPSSGPSPNTGITITGTNFISVTGITIGTTPIPAGYTVSSETSITGVSIPAGLADGTYDIRVTNSAGQSPINAPADQYTVATPPPPVIDSVKPVYGPYGDSPWTTYLNIYGSNFGGTQGSNVVNFGSVDAGLAVLWSDNRIVVAVPSSVVSGSPVAVNVTVNGMTSNSDKTFTPVQGKMIDNIEGAGTHDYYDSGAGADEVDVSLNKSVDEYYDGRYSMRVNYPGATGSDWGGFWRMELLTQTYLDLSGCNMLVFRVKGDGTNNTIRLDVTEYKDGNHDEPYSSLDKYPLSDSSDFKEYKIPFSRLWRNEYPGSMRDDDVFSRMVKGYTFVYQGTDSTSAYNYVDFVYAVQWSGPVIDQIGPNCGTIGDYITIEGSGFGSSGTVTFNGIAAVPASWSDTRIVTRVPAGATTGPVGVIVGADTSNYVNFTVTTELRPVISGISPSSGPSGTQVTISGTNFGNDPRVDYRATISNHVVFGTAKVTDLNVISWSTTQIVVNVPSLSAGVYPVQVRANDKDSNMVDFTVGAGGTGSKDYILRSTANGNFNWIALAYTNTGLATTTDLAASIGNTIPAGSRNAWVDVVEVRMWDAANQQEITYSCMWDGSTWNDSGVNAPLTVGNMYKVTVPLSANGLTWRLSGTIPAAGSVQFTLSNVANGNYNWITTPAYTQGMSTTTDLAASIGNTIPAGSRNAWVDVVEVRAWDAANQQEITYSCMWDGSTWNDSGVNASLSVPDAYVVTVPSTANGNIWP